MENNLFELLKALNLGGSGQMTQTGNINSVPLYPEEAYPSQNREQGGNFLPLLLSAMGQNGDALSSIMGMQNGGDKIGPLLNLLAPKRKKSSETVATSSICDGEIPCDEY